MSNGQAWFEIEDLVPSRDVDPSPPVSGVRESLGSLPSLASDGRSAAATVPGAGVDRFAATYPVVEDPFTPPSLEWCVDLGAQMITKTTFDLWSAIEHGEIRGSMLVWREGMECWTPVDRVGELACALEAAAPNAEGAEPAEATTNPEVRTPAIELALAPEPQHVSSRRQVPVRAGNARGGKWIALGSAVAASAIAAAALTMFLAQPPIAASSGAREGATAPVRAQGAAMSREAPEVPEAMDLDPVTIAAPLPPKARHDDPGQHRRRAGGRR